MDDFKDGWMAWFRNIGGACTFEDSGEDLVRAVFSASCNKIAFVLIFNYAFSIVVYRYMVTA